MLPLHFIWLPTDILFLLTTLILSSYMISNFFSQLETNPWQRLIRIPSAVVSALVILFFYLIALLDSIHVQWQVPFGLMEVDQVYSVLDIVIAPIGQLLEKTYSAPFATQAFVPTMIIDNKGIMMSYYPSLQFVHKTLSAQSHIIMNDLLQSVASSMLLVIAGIALAIFWPRRNSTWLKQWRHYMRVKRNGDFPFWSAWGTIFVLLFTFIALVTLSSHYHVLGTDQVGQDLFYQSIKSVRTGMIIGILTTLIMAPFAIMLGMLAGYFMGWLDDVIQYIYTTLSSVPGVLLITATILAGQIYMSNHADLFSSIEGQADARLLLLCGVLGLTSWTTLCRMLRGETLKVREMDYVAAAKVLGSSQLTILTRHILPNIFHIVIISIALDFSGLVLAEAVLSYVGVGVDPLTPSFGNMIDAARMELAREPVVWWPLFSSFLCMLVLIFAANIFADRLRESFDPRSLAGNNS